MNRAHEGLTPSPWVERFATLIPRDGEVLDLACGAGRHTRLLCDQGHRVVALDRDISKLTDMEGREGIEGIEADLENGAPWPLTNRRFSAIIVTNYLFRPLFPRLLDSLAEGGVLIYETFAAGNERFGKPSNPDFLLRPGELLETVRGCLHVIAFEDGIVERPKSAVVQRICAIRPTAGTPPAKL